MIRNLAALALLALAIPSVAQEEEVDAATGRPLKFKDRTEIDFDVVELKGTLVGPHIVGLVEAGPLAFTPMVRLRTDFQAELKRSVGEVE
jgi:hypothetical protein